MDPFVQVTKDAASNVTANVVNGGTTVQNGTSEEDIQSQCALPEFNQHSAEVGRGRWIYDYRLTYP